MSQIPSEYLDGFAFWVRHKTKNLTAKETLTFMESREYLEVRNNQALRGGKPDYQTWKKLKMFYEVEAEELYRELLSDGKTVAEAEFELVNLQIIPPTYYEMVYCCKCQAYTPAKEPEFDQVAQCLWCEKGLSPKG